MKPRKVANIKIDRSSNAVEVSPKRGRGRPREFDRDEGLAKAMRLFWLQGYESTSMADLRAALGVTQASLYAAYGSKEQLFRDSVDLYRRTAGITTPRALAMTSSAFDAIHAMLQDAVDAFTAPGAPGGCLIVLGTINCSVDNKPVQNHLTSMRRQTAASILERLKRGQQEGDISEEAPIRALAAYYATVLHGLSIEAKDGASKETLTMVVDCAMNSWKEISKTLE